MNEHNRRNKGRSLLAVFAHPDDESLTMGGTLARYSRQGVDLSLICATRGEWGPISDPSLATRENLGQVRERELRAACELLGVRWLQFLDCFDGQVMHSDWSEIEERLVRYIRLIKPQVIVTFGPDGIYGHPDHIAIGQLTATAFNSAGNEACFPEHLEEGLKPHQAEKLYYTQIPEGLVSQMVEAVRAEHSQARIWDMDPGSFGVPEDTITTIIDVSKHAPTKLKALRCHRTQLDDNNIFTVINEATARIFLAEEYFRLASPQRNFETVETDLFEGLDDTA